MKRNLNLYHYVILLAGLIFPAGCGFATSRNVELPSPSPTAALSVDEFYPASPEEVVYLFLEAYPSNPAAGIKYLSPRLTASLTENTALDLLPVSDIPNGYNLQQGSTSLETRSSVILVELTYEPAVYWVEFSLALVDGKWKIDRISTG